MNNTIIPHFVFWIWILVILAKKRNFLVVFILTPPIFRWKTDKLPKKSGQLPDIPKILPKKILVAIAQKLTPKIQKLDPPPIGPIGRGLILKSYVCDVFYWAWNRSSTKVLSQYFFRKLTFLLNCSLLNNIGFWFLKYFGMPKWAKSFRSTPNTRNKKKCSHKLNHGRDLEKSQFDLLEMF